MSLSIAPLIPLWLVITLASVGLCIALATIIAKRRGGLFRLATTLLMAVALLNPSMVREERRHSRGSLAFASALRAAATNRHSQK